MKDLWKLFENAGKVGEPSTLLRSQGNKALLECWQKFNQAVFLESTLQNVSISLKVFIFSQFVLHLDYVPGGKKIIYKSFF